MPPRQQPASFADLAETPPGAAGYLPAPVPRRLIRELLELATQAPSNFNRQPWQFLVADEPPACRWLANVLRRRRDQGPGGDPLPGLGAAPPERDCWDLLEQCPAWVVAFYKPSPERIEQVIAATLGTGDVSRFNPNLVSLGMAVQNLLLAARDRGLGGHLHFAAAPFLAGELNRLLHLPPNLHLAAVISLGRPVVPPATAAAPPQDHAVQFLDDAGPLGGPADSSPAPRGFAELARTRRSVRRYEPRPVPHGLLQDLLRLAVSAPSPLAPPPWRFLVAESPPRCRQIAERLGHQIAHVEHLRLDPDTAYFVHPFLDHQRRWNHPLEEARALVLCCYESARFPAAHGPAAAPGDAGEAVRDPRLLSLGMAIQNLLLAAHDRGVGACMQSGPVPFLRGSVNELLGLPPWLELAGVVSLGYPAESPAPKPRKPVERVTRFLEAPDPAQLQA